MVELESWKMSAILDAILDLEESDTWDFRELLRDSTHVSEPTLINQLVMSYFHLLRLFGLISLDYLPNPYINTAHFFGKC